MFDLFCCLFDFPLVCLSYSLYLCDVCCCFVFSLFSSLAGWPLARCPGAAGCSYRLVSLDVGRALDVLEREDGKEEVVGTLRRGSPKWVDDFLRNL